MEKLDKILEQSPSLTSIPDQNNYEPSEAERKEELRRILKITSWDNTFENFKAVKGTVDSLKHFKAILKNPTWHMLLCYGSAGCGKTHLCEALSIEYLKQGYKVVVWEWSEIIRNLKKAMRQNDGSYDVMFDGYRKCNRLIIDDVGLGGADSAWCWGEFEDLINYRYRQGLVTVVTTNLDITKLPDRAVSRFRDALKSRICLNEAQDYRPLKVSK